MWQTTCSMAYGTKKKMGTWYSMWSRSASFRYHCAIDAYQISDMQTTNYNSEPQLVWCCCGHDCIVWSQGYPSFRCHRVLLCSHKNVLASEASKPKLVYLYFCCSLIYCYYLLTVLFIDLFTLFIFMAIFACWMLLKDLRITLFGAGIFIPVNMIQDWFQF